MAKRGRQKAAELLHFPNEGWFEREGTRRGAGKTFKYRFVIQIGKWGYSVGMMNEDSENLLPGAKFPGSLSNMFSCLRGIGYEDLTPYEFITTLNNDLAKRLNKTFALSVKESLTYAEMELLLKEMSVFYELDYARHEGIRSRLTGVTTDDDEDETEE